MAGPPRECGGSPLFSAPFRLLPPPSATSSECTHSRASSSVLAGGAHLRIRFPKDVEEIFTARRVRLEYARRVRLEDAERSRGAER